MDLKKIDALIAEHVIGWKVTRDISGEYWTYPGGNIPTPANLLPKYSSDIAAAWEVVEKMGPLAICLAALKIRGVDVK